MPTRHDEVDAIRYASETDVLFDRVKERVEEYNPFAWLGYAGTTASDLASAISAFMAQLNNEYCEEDPAEEVSFDEAMGFDREEV